MPSHCHIPHGSTNHSATRSGQRLALVLRHATERPPFPRSSAMRIRLTVLISRRDEALTVFGAPTESANVAVCPGAPYRASPGTLQPSFHVDGTVGAFRFHLSQGTRRAIPIKASMRRSQRIAWAPAEPAKTQAHSLRIVPLAFSQCPEAICEISFSHGIGTVSPLRDVPSAPQTP